jgi:hypothetical protein
MRCERKSSAEGARGGARPLGARCRRVLVRQGYLNEWTWRYNRRESDVPMFHDLLDEAISRTV